MISSLFYIRHKKGAPMTDTIAAISTPRGVGGVALIRISGADAVNVASRVFFPVSGRSLTDVAHSTAVYGKITESDVNIDDGIATVFYAPRSFTGENTVEITCHGGVYVTGRVLSAVLAAGARPALPGEFTRRAFISGKLSLSEAEAVGDLLYAKTEGQMLLSGSASSSILSGKVEQISSALTSLIARVAVTIDYPEENLSDIADDELRDRISDIAREVSSLVSSYKTGRAVSEGINAVITGRPNAGKSTLYNLLLGEDAAIVTDIAGTTRDTLTAEVAAGKVLLRLSDTAGIRRTDDVIESIGVDRAREKAASAELLIALFDATAAPTEEDREIASAGGKVKIAVINKTDAAVGGYVEQYEAIAREADADVIYASLKNGDGRSELIAMIESAFTDPSFELGRDAVIANARQAAEARSASESLMSALDALDAGMPVDIVSGELEDALSALMRLDGRDVTDAVIGEIFAKFCVGK